METADNRNANEHALGVGTFFDFKRVNPTRSIAGFSLGAVIGLGIAGYGLLTAQGTSTHIVPPENVALVNQKPILRTDFIAQTETQYSEPFAETTLPERLRVIDDMIREELFVQRGLELDFPGTDPDTRTALVAAVEQQVVADVTTHEATDTELMEYYLDNKATYATEGLLTFRDLFVPKGEADGMPRLQKATSDLRAGKSVDDVKKQFRLSERGIGDEQFYFAAKIHLGDALYTKAVPLEPRQVTEPVEIDGAPHIALIVANTRPVPLTFEQARARVLADFKMTAQNKLEDADERYLRDKAEILVADDYADAYSKAEAAKDLKSMRDAAREAKATTGAK